MEVGEGCSVYYLELIKAHGFATVFLAGRRFHAHRQTRGLLELARSPAVRGIGQRSRYQVGQLVGARNSRPAPEVVKVVGTFVEEINNRVHVATMVGAVD